MQKQTLPRAVFKAVPLLLILAFGLGLRLYRLQEQSLWYDEYLTVCNLSAPDALSHHALMRIHYTDQAAGPLYYTLQYFYARLFGTSLPILRLLSVLIGVLCILSVYFLGQRLYGRVAGLVAALCLAMSPQHIWWGQEPRGYEFVTLLVILSSLFLFRAIEERRGRWWALHFAANALLPWTHVCAVFFLPVEGFLILLVFRRRFRRAVLWMGIQFLFLAPWAVWMLLMPHLTNDQASPGISGWSIAQAIFAGETITHNTSLLPPWKTNPPDIVHGTPLLAYNMMCTRTLILLFVAATLLLALRLGGPWRAPPGASETAGGERAAFVLLLIILPGLTLGLLEIVMHLEFLQPPYSLFNTVGLAIALGATVTACRWRIPQVFAAIAVMALYGYQLAIFLPETTRTNWRGGTQFVKSHAQPNDLVINLQPCLYPAEYELDYYLKNQGFDLRLLRTFQAACDESVAFFQRTGMTPSSASSQPSVWVVFELYFLLWNFDFGLDNIPQGTEDVLQLFVQRSRDTIFAAWEKGLADRGLTCTRTELSGQFNLVILQIRPAAGAAVHASSEPVPWLTNIDCGGLLNELHVSFPNDQDRREALDFLRAQFPSWPQRRALSRVIESVHLMERGRLDLGEALARYIVQQNPGYALAHFSLGLALAAQGKDAEAEVEMNEVLQSNWALRHVYADFVHLLQERDYGALKAEEERIEQMGYDVFLSALRAVCRAKCN